MPQYRVTGKKGVRMSEDTPQPLTVTPIQTATVSSLAYEELKKAIIRGTFAPGERLVESRLAKLLNVSRTPLREAMLALEKEALLERLPHGGVQVPEFSVKEIEELYELRATLESYTARKAAERLAAGTLTPAELQSLNDMREKLLSGTQNTESASATDSVSYTTHFHLLVHQLSDNQKCISVLENVMDSMRRYRPFVPSHRNKPGLEEHLAILDAISNGNPLAAESLMRQHIEESGVLYKALVTQAVKKRDGST